MSNPGGPQDSPPPGYLIPSDDQRGVSAQGDAPPPPPAQPAQQPPEPAPPAFTLPSAEPDSPVTRPPRPGAPDNPGTTSIPVDSGPAGYGAPRGTYESGSYSQPNPPAYGTPPAGNPQSAPPAYQQSSPPAYQQSVPPHYQQSSPPGYEQPSYPQYPQSAAPTSGYDQASGYQQMSGYPIGPPAPQYSVALPQSKPPNSGLALGAMITGIASSALIVLVCCIGMFAGVPAVLAGGTGLVLGIMARKQIMQSNGMQGGAGLALTGIITGAIGGALGLLLVLLGIFAIGMSASGAFDN